MNSRLFTSTLSRCISELECWVEGRLESHDPILRFRAQSTEEYLEIARGAYHILQTSTFFGGLKKVTAEEVEAMRRCLLEGMAVMRDESFNRKIEKCLLILQPGDI